VSGEEPEDVARLRAAFASVEGDGQERVDAERIFDALHGTLDPEDRRAIVDELASNPGAAEAWRLARELAPEPGARGAKDIDARMPPSAIALAWRFPRHARCMAVRETVHRWCSPCGNRYASAVDARACSFRQYSRLFCQRRSG
jgi:hypothetical protein